MTYLGSDHGLASLHDVALLTIMWSILDAFYQGVAIVETAGVDAATFTPLAKGIVDGVGGWLTTEAQLIDDGKFPPAEDSTIKTHLAAMEHLIHEGESLGINTEFPRLMKALTGRAVADGRGGSSYAAMIEQFRKPLEVQ